MELKYLSLISDTVNTFLKSKNKKITNNDELIKVIRRCLPHITPGMEFNPYFVDVDSSDNPFILGIYPDINEVEAKSNIMLEYMQQGKTKEFLNEWANIKKWHIEIDSNLLTKGHRLCVDDGDQFVALLCHEVGHAMVENPLSLMENYVYSRKIASTIDNMIMSKNPLVRKLALPMYVHTLQFKIVVKNSDMLHEEVAADHYIPDEYRGALISYIDNHILNSPDQSNIIVSKQDFDNEQLTAIKFSRESVSMMRKRKEALKRSMKVQYSNSNSSYMKNLVHRIGQVVMGYDPEKDETNVVYENSAIRCLERDVEECTKYGAALFEATDVTPRDISILQVQAEDIKTVDQKLFVIHTIYDYIEILEAQKAKTAKKISNPDMLRTATAPQDEKIKTLYAIRDNVMKINVSDVGDRYGIFVKYPKGYEG